MEVCLVSGRPFSSFKTGERRGRSFEIEKIGLTRPREELYSRINQRVLNMIDEGLVEEVRSLLPYRDCQARRPVGVEGSCAYLDKKIPLEDADGGVQRNTRHYAKKQLTWWRRDPSIRWVDIH